jgi:hypothetical protein
LRARGAYLSHSISGVSTWSVVALSALVLGTLSKETGLLLSTYVVLLELMKRGSTAREVRWSRSVLVISFALLAAATAAWGLRTFGTFSDGYATRSLSLQERLLTQPRVLIEYVRLTLVPVLSDMKFIHDDLEISRGWLAPWMTSVAAAGLMLVAASAWHLRKRFPLYAYGIGLFFFGHLLESSIIPLDLMYEHRQYMPSVGLLLAVGSISIPLCERSRYLVIALLPLLALLATMTWIRAGTWSSESNLFSEMVRINRDSPRAMTMVANWFGNRGQIDEARALLARFDSPAARLNAHFYDCLQGGVLHAEDFESLPDPEIVGIYEASGIMYLGRAGLSGSCSFPAHAYLELLDRWMERPIHGSRSGLLFYRGYYLDRAGRYEEAISAFEQAYLTGGSPVALVIAAELSIDAGDLAQAEQILERARRVSRKGAIERDIQMASERLRTARGHPDRLEPFDPFKK